MSQPNNRRASKRITTWEAFDRWLSYRSKGVKFHPCRHGQCPLAFFSNSKVFSSAQKIDGIDALVELPTWAQMFVAEFDRNTPRTKDNQVTAEQARKALRRVVDLLK